LLKKSSFVARKKNPTPSTELTRRKLCYMQPAKERLRSYTIHIRLSS
jgi:hypothetical protein